jgi:hypothetical protein
MKYDEQYWDRKIEEIMNNFDFTRTYRVMEALNWEWCDQGVPDVEDQRETARDLLEQIVDDRFSKPTGRFGTGGFMAEIDINTGFLGLYFIAAEWEECDE